MEDVSHFQKEYLSHFSPLTAYSFPGLNVQFDCDLLGSTERDEGVCFRFLSGVLEIAPCFQ